MLSNWTAYKTSGMDVEIKKLLEKYGKSVPRYTSYPPATQFRDTSPADSYRDCLRSLPEDQNISLYLHIPFCRSLCSYCGCMTKIVHNDSPIRDYVRLMEKEIEIFARASLSHHKISHIHFGGGSPNLLLYEDFISLLAKIQDNFVILPNAEIAMEADPRQLTRNKIHDYSLAGINRISLGVQDFQESTQKAINRIQPFSQIERCMSWIRDSGISSVNFDLMYGLPYQTTESVSDNLVKALSLEPDRIALFGYAHVPWMKPHQKLLEKHVLPNFSERYMQSEVARTILLKNGYFSIGMDHFAKETDSLLSAYRARSIKRNFQGYTDDNAGSLVGFGLSAISKLPKAYIQNTTQMHRYRDKIENGLFPDERWIHINNEDSLRGEIIENLMCYFSVDCAALCVRHGFPSDYLDQDLKKLQLMKEDGLLSIVERFVNVTKIGEAFIRPIAACFDRYYEEGNTLHARAI